MNAEEILTLLRNRADELKQQCEARMNSIGLIDKNHETEEQGKTIRLADSEFDTSAELYSLIQKIERN
jgi:hypothetical protein